MGGKSPHSKPTTLHYRISSANNQLDFGLISWRDAGTANDSSTSASRHMRSQTLKVREGSATVLCATRGPGFRHGAASGRGRSIVAARRAHKTVIRTVGPQSKRATCSVEASWAQPAKRRRAERLRWASGLIDLNCFRYVLCAHNQYPSFIGKESLVNRSGIVGNIPGREYLR